MHHDEFSHIASKKAALLLDRKCHLSLVVPPKPAYLSYVERVITAVAKCLRQYKVSVFINQELDVRNHQAGTLANFSAFFFQNVKSLVRAKSESISRW